MNKKKRTVQPQIIIRPVPNSVVYMVDFGFISNDTFRPIPGVSDFSPMIGVDSNTLSNFLHADKYFQSCAFIVADRLFEFFRYLLTLDSASNLNMYRDFIVLSFNSVDYVPQEEDEE